MAEDKGSFVVYTDIKEIIDELDDSQVAALFRAMLDYQITGKVPKLNGTLRYIFIPIRQQMDRDSEKWERIKEKRASAGRVGGLKSGEVRTKQKQANEANASFGSSNEANEANEAVNVTVTVNGTVNGTVTDTVSDSDALSVSSFLIEYLNNKAGTEYKPDQTVTRLVQGLIDSGYSADQMRTVIDKKCSDWLGSDKMRSFLRPSTLFGDKFGEYLAAPVSLSLEREKDEAEKRSDLSRQLTEKRDTLNVLRASLDEIPRGTRMDERRALKEQIATLEDSIGLIERRLA